MQGIGNRTVRLKLVVDDNFNPDYSMSKIYSDESVLAKTNVKQIDLNGSALITSYELFQNYPNPFNPSTTIKYQIPKSGNVSLKVRHLFLLGENNYQEYRILFQSWLQPDHSLFSEWPDL